MRNRICYTALRRRILFALAAILALAVAVAVFCWLLTINPAFFDENAVVGVPDGFSEENGYTSYVAEGVCAVGICGRPDINGKDVKLFLTNPLDNSVLLRAEIYSVSFTYDKLGNITGANPDECIGKSGFLRPGEYVENITLDHSLKDEMTYVMIKIATYKEETGTSNGFFYINTALFK